VAGRSQTQRFALRADPRVVADGVAQQDFVDQLALSIQVRDALSEARMAAYRVDKARDDLRRGVAVEERLAELLAKLETAETYTYPTPMLIDQLSYLYSNLDRADQEPGTDSYERYTELDALLKEYIAELERILRATAAE
jgi:hypothetical protein